MKGLEISWVSIKYILGIQIRGFWPLIYSTSNTFESF